MSGAVTIKRRSAFSIIDDRVFTDRRLSLDTRLVLGWMLGRPDGWLLHISHIQRVFNIGDHQWKRMRDELIEAGYFSSSKHRSADGSFAWTNVVDEAAIPPHTIPGLAGDGETTPGGTTPGAAMDDQAGDITEDGEQQEFKQDYVKQENSTRPRAREAGQFVDLTATSPEFQQFWAVYPKKKDLSEAWVAWQQVAPSEELAATILASAQANRQSEDWQKEDGRYVPRAAKWLSDHGWEQSPGRRSNAIATVYPGKGERRMGDDRRVRGMKNATLL